MKNAINYVGLDVHKETIAVAMSDQEGRNTSLGTIPNRADSVSSSRAEPAGAGYAIRPPLPSAPPPTSPPGGEGFLAPSLLNKL